MMNTLRTFIGIPLPPVVQHQITTAQQSWKAVLPDIRWTKAENLHLTLRFLGDIEETLVNQIYTCMQKAVTGISPFTLTLHGMGVFPNLARPRVLWLGIGEGKERLQALYVSLDNSLRSLGFPSEGRVYTPHLTLARFKTSSRKSVVQSLIEQGNTYTFDPIVIQTLELIHSQLQPTGPIYTPLRTVALS